MRAISACIWALLVSTLCTVSAQAQTAAQPDTSLCLDALGNIHEFDAKESLIPVVYGEDIDSVELLSSMVRNVQGLVIIVKGGDFSGWDFRETTLARICFQDTNLSNTNWQGMNAPQIGFIGTDLTGANMAGAQMPNVLFRNAQLVGTNASGANFRHGQFDGGWFDAKIDGWVLDQADLTGFRFACGITFYDGCPVYTGDPGISLAGANLTQADMGDYAHYDDVSGAVLDNTRLSPAQLPRFADADWRGDVRLDALNGPVSFTPDEVQQILAAHNQANKDEPSFACAKARTAVEKEICGEYQSELRQKDRDMARLYARARRARKVTSASQTAWLRQRNGCAKAEFISDCLRQSYDDRIDALLGAMGEQDWLERGEKRIFVDEVLELPDTAKEAPWYPRLALAMVRDSGAELMIARQRDGRYMIAGNAIRANAHECGVHGLGLFLDTNSGWYTAPLDNGDEQPIFRYFDGKIRILGDGQPDYKEWPNASQHISCGARGSFGNLVALDLPDDVVDGIAEAIRNSR